jgi:hypothetical protein
MRLEDEELQSSSPASEMARRAPELPGDATAV